MAALCGHLTHCPAHACIQQLARHQHASQEICCKSFSKHMLLLVFIGHLCIASKGCLPKGLLPVSLWLSASRCCRLQEFDGQVPRNQARLMPSNAYRWIQLVPKGCGTAAAAGAGSGAAAAAAGVSRQRASQGINQAPAEDAALLHAGEQDAYCLLSSVSRHSSVHFILLLFRPFAVHDLLEAINTIIFNYPTNTDGLAM